MSSRSPTLTIDQLVALNDEIQALTRAGVPLERGLRVLGQDLPGKLGAFALHLSERLERGEGLEQVLVSQDRAFPAVYRAMVAAGLRSGRLPVALESISRSVRQAADLRRSMIVAMVYPLLLAAIATIVFALSMTHTVPVIYDIYAALAEARPAWYDWSVAAATQLQILLPFVWAAVVAFGVVWWWNSRRAARFATRSWSWLPTIGTVRATGRMATFADVLAALVDQRVPLDEGVMLAAAAGGGRALEADGKQLAESVRRGSSTVATVSGIPPLLVWLILTAQDQAHLADSLRQAAKGYRRRAVRLSLLLGAQVPIFLSAAVGGSMVLMYVLLMMAPVYHLLMRLGMP